MFARAISRKKSKGGKRSGKRRKERSEEETKEQTRHGKKGNKGHAAAEVDERGYYSMFKIRAFAGYDELYQRTYDQKKKGKATTKRKAKKNENDVGEASPPEKGEFDPDCDPSKYLTDTGESNRSYHKSFAVSFTILVSPPFLSFSILFSSVAYHLFHNLYTHLSFPLM